MSKMYGCDEPNSTDTVTDRVRGCPENRLANSCDITEAHIASMQQLQLKPAREYASQYAKPGN
jgi:hypothetical protein